MKPQINDTFRCMKNCADMSVFMRDIENGRCSHRYSQKSGLVGASTTSSKRNPLKHSNIILAHTTANAERNNVPLSTSR